MAVPSASDPHFRADKSFYSSRVLRRYRFQTERYKATVAAKFLLNGFRRILTAYIFASAFYRMSALPAKAFACERL